MTESKYTHDVIIVGAGLAGCAVALSLAKCAPDVSFLLVSDDSPTFKIGESLPPEAKRILHHLHPLLPKLLAAQEKEGIHVPSDGTASAWGSSEIEERHAILNPFGHGWHLDRAAFDETLRQVLRDSCGEDCIKKAKLVDIRRSSRARDCWTLQIVDSETRNTHHASWIIDATGRKASVGNKLGAKTLKYDDLLAFYAVLSSDSSEDDDWDKRTLIESTSTGWWYTSLLSHNRRVVVYHTDATSLTAKLARRWPGFVDLLHEETSYISSLVQEHSYDVITVPGNNFPHCTAAGSSSLSPPGNEEAQWFAVGDAAMAFDPLSAQGMMTALEMGYFVGRMLGTRLTGTEPVDVADTESLGNMAGTFEKIRAEYEGKKRHYYGAERRFQTDFWRRRAYIQ